MKALAVATFMLISLLSVSAKACDPSFSFHNDTRWTVVAIYTKHSDDNGWSQEQLGRDTVLQPGQKINFDFRNTYSSTFGIKVVFADKVQAEWTDVPLCSITQMSLTYNSVTEKHNLDWQ